MQKKYNSVLPVRVVTLVLLVTGIYENKTIRRFRVLEGGKRISKVGMMEPTIIFDNVSKKFSKGYVSDSLRDTLAAPFKDFFIKNGKIASRLMKPIRQKRRAGPLELNRPVRQRDEFWALKDMSFEVRPGEALGIIGPNGSGKSTTLKLLSRILRPNGGRIIVKGRVSALIELGSGFHPDLTGRENIFLNASILGMSKEEIKEKYDEIVDFAELHEFVDMPVKWYSSGMYARLGFSVAANTRPDILLVDEVLSVGDVDFQKKCIDKMLSFKEKGVMIIFVSHNMQAMASLCERTLLLQKGSIIDDGSTAEIVPLYLKKVISTYKEDDDAVFLEFGKVYDENNCQRSLFISGQKAVIEVAMIARKDLPNVYATIWIQKRDGFFVFGVETYRFNIKNFSVRKGQKIYLKVQLTLNLVPGEYQIGASIFDVSNLLNEKAVFAETFEKMIINEATGCCGIAYLEPILIEENIR